MKEGIFGLILGILFFYWPILLALVVFIYGRGFRRRLSSGLTIVCSIALMVYIRRIENEGSGLMIPMYSLLFPFICAGMFAVLFAIEGITQFFKDRGFRGWWGVPLVSLAILLTWGYIHKFDIRVMLDLIKEVVGKFLR